MELQQLRTFVSIVEHRSFTKASQALHLSQPAVTRQIHGLEQELGAPLLERRIRRVAVTPAGEVLEAYANRILSMVRDCRASVSQVQQGGVGRVSVATSGTAATYLLPLLLARFRALHPRIDLTVFTGGSQEAAQMVLDERVDLGVVMHLHAHRDLKATVGGSYRLVAAVSPAHSLAGRRTVSINELIEQPLIVMQKGANLRAVVDNLFASKRAAPRVTIEVDHVEAMKKMAEANLGVAIVPDIAVEAGELRVLPIRGAAFTQRRWSAIHRRNRTLTTAMRAFLEVLLAKQKS